MNFISLIKDLFHRNTIPNEWLDVGTDIASFSQSILTPDEIREADSLTLAIISGGKQKELAITFLQNKIGTYPKRPIYYVTLQYLPLLPHHTRETMRYLGDYIDGLVKCTATDVSSWFYHMHRSLGSNLPVLHGKLSDDLVRALAVYNKVIYTPAKHDFNVRTREHRFTPREVVFACLITVKLAAQLKTLSSMAQQYANDTLPEEYF